MRKQKHYYTNSFLNTMCGIKKIKFGFLGRKALLLEELLQLIQRKEKDITYGYY